MPIYEYKCHKCGEKFEIFTLSQSDTSVICPKCGSENIERVMSSFASTGTNSGQSSGSTCGHGGHFS
ncbi:MAG TPA: hypothetical protein DCZ43_03025 [candidate division Zixibacteria bacterium]|nr:hypothetical protein [candidate division Zixibacteria bacterium]